MLTEKINQLTNDITKAKDEWILDTLKKNDLIKNENLTNWDIMWLKEELKFKILHDEKVTKLYLGEELLGEWFEDYVTEVKDGSFSIKMHYWN